MSKKNNQDQQSQKTLDDYIKLLFGFANNRLNKYLYFNIPGLDNSIVASNGNYELIISGNPITLSTHLIQFKDNNLYKSIIDYFKIPTDKPYILRIDIVLKALIRNTLKDLTVKQDNNKLSVLLSNNTQVAIEAEVDKEESVQENTEEDNATDAIVDTFADSTVLGQYVDNVYAWKILEECLLDLNKYSERYFLSNNKNYIKEELTFDNVTWYKSLMYRPIKLDSNFFNDKLYLDIYAVYIDGQDAISIKSFIKKVNGICNLYVWSENNQTIKCMAIYEDSEVVIKVIRPFYEIIPLKKTKED